MESGDSGKSRNSTENKRHTAPGQPLTSRSPNGGTIPPSPFLLIVPLVHLGGMVRSGPVYLAVFLPIGSTYLPGLCEDVSWVVRPTRGLMPFSRSRQLRGVSRVTAVQAICAILLLNSALSRQNPAEKEPVRNQQSGMSTGSAHAPVKDALSRPITAGGFVDGAPVIFIDVTHTAGIDRFHHRSGGPEKKTILETPGSGVALLDYDNDGWLDIYLVNGSTFPALQGKQSAPHAMLLHNNHDGTFTDVTEKAGVTNERWGFGAAVGDYANDGWPDIYVSNFGKNRLYRNNHDGTFTDVAEAAGVTLGGWSTGATWGDYDRDGLLDLFVPGYVKFDPEHPPISGQGGLPAGFCQFRGVEVMCGPRGLPGEGDHLFHNNGIYTVVEGK